MAKFRTNHGHKRGRGAGNSFFRSIILVFVAFGILVVLLLLVRKDFFGTLAVSGEEESYELPYSGTDAEKRYFLPEGGSDEVIHHRYYSLAYNENREQADWVAYELTAESLRVPNVERTNWYNPDPAVKSSSADYYDYKGSGYTRGHLAPAGDMAFNQEAMEESFYMSNISPQKRTFNNGIWKELEECVRDWAYDNSRLYVVTGPVFKKRINRRIGNNKVAVPDHFYKIVLDLNDPEHKGIAFVIPNDLSTRPLLEYAMTIDEAEEIIGLDFFPDLISSEAEIDIEKTIDPTDWPVSQKRFERRIKNWNKE